MRIWMGKRAWHDFCQQRPQMQIYTACIHAPPQKSSSTNSLTQFRKHFANTFRNQAKHTHIQTNTQMHTHAHVWLLHTRAHTRLPKNIYSNERNIGSIHIVTIYGLHLLEPPTEIGKLMFILICSSNPIESNWIESKCFPVHLLPIREIDYSFWLSAAADRIAPILITCGLLSLSYSFVRSFTPSLTFRFFCPVPPNSFDTHSLDAFSLCFFPCSTYLCSISCHFALSNQIFVDKFAGKWLANKKSNHSVAYGKNFFIWPLFYYVPPFFQRTSKRIWCSRTWRGDEKNNLRSI